MKAWLAGVDFASRRIQATIAPKAAAGARTSSHSGTRDEAARVVAASGLSVAIAAQPTGARSG